MKICPQCLKSVKYLSRNMCINCYYLNRKNGTIKLLQKNISPNTLTYDEEQILIGGILGDSNLSYVPPNKKNTKKTARLRIKRALADINYLQWQFDIFKNFIDKENMSIATRINPRSGGILYNCSFQTRVSCLIYEYYEQWYIDGKDKKGIEKKIKTVPKDINLDYLAIAVWLCDDGCICDNTKNGSLSCTFYTDCFDLNSLNILINKLYNKTGIEFRINKHQDNYILRAGGKKKILSFYEQIKNYIPASMYRKFKHIIPFLADDDPIKIEYLRQKLNSKSTENYYTTVYNIIITKILEIFTHNDKFTINDFIYLYILPELNLSLADKTNFIRNHLNLLVYKKLITTNKDPDKIEKKNEISNYTYTLGDNFKTILINHINNPEQSLPTIVTMNSSPKIIFAKKI